MYFFWFAVDLTNDKPDKNTASASSQLTTNDTSQTRETDTPPVPDPENPKPKRGYPITGSHPDMMNYPTFNMYQQHWNMANQYGVHFGQSFGMPTYNDSFANSPRSLEVPPPPGEDAPPPPPSDEEDKPPLPPVPPGDAEDLVPPPPPPLADNAEIDEDGIEMEISDVEISDVPTGIGIMWKFIFLHSIIFFHSHCCF